MNAQELGGDDMSNNLYTYLKDHGEDPILDTSGFTNSYVYDSYKNLAYEHLKSANEPEALVRSHDHKFEFVYINNPEINAFAFIYEKTDVIGLNIGTVHQLEAYFTKALNTGIFEWVVEKKQRHILLEVLMFLAVEFIILHELGHLYHGHLEFDSCSRPFRKMIERNLDYEEHLESRTLEMDADAYATLRSFGKFMSVDLDQNLPIIRSANDLLRFWIFATNSFFYLFEEEAVDFQHIHQENYYPRALRQAVNIDISTIFVKQNKPEFAECYEEIFREMFPLCEKVYQEVGTHNPSFNRVEELLSLADRRRIEYMEEVNLYYREVLYDKLLKHARNKLYKNL